MSMSVLVVRGHVTSKFMYLNISAVDTVGELVIYVAAFLLLWRRQRYQ